MPFSRIIITLCSLQLIAFYLLVPRQVAGQASKASNVQVLFNPVPKAFPLVAAHRSAAFYIDSSDAKVVSIAAQAFRKDVGLVSGVFPSSGNTGQMKGFVVIAGTIGKSRLVDQLIRSRKLSVATVRNKWECFIISVIDHPFPNVPQALVIAGSDARGTAFGLFELSQMIGVSPFYWWADITPQHHNEVYVTPGVTISGSPSVKFRGIFINDEDWGLQPWAAKTFEPESGDIGPKTYSMVFELLLRLKANLIWPAMHPSTKPFFSFPDNKKSGR